MLATPGAISMRRWGEGPVEGTGGETAALGRKQTLRTEWISSPRVFPAKECWKFRRADPVRGPPRPYLQSICRERPPHPCPPLPPPPPAKAEADASVPLSLLGRILDLKTGTVKKEGQQSSMRMCMGSRRSFICRMRCVWASGALWPWQVRTLLVCEEGPRWAQPGSVMPPQVLPSPLVVLTTAHGPADSWFVLEGRPPSSYHFKVSGSPGFQPGCPRLRCVRCLMVLPGSFQPQPHQALFLNRFHTYSSVFLCLLTHF